MEIEDVLTLMISFGALIAFFMSEKDTKKITPHILSGM